CSSSEPALPSQNCVALAILLIMVGVFLLPCFSFIPIAAFVLFENPLLGRWQLEQETVLFIDSRLSKKSKRPNSTFDLVMGLS
ncbi:MAG TPA: hypothetical protein QF517_06595, partial [Pseudomonadales bacterium]|nr:hypothetical protein [Pseudomonadales bacterium]